MGEYIPETANAWRKGYNHLETTTYNRVFLFLSRLFVSIIKFQFYYFPGANFKKMTIFNRIIEFEWTKFLQKISFLFMNFDWPTIRMRYSDWCKI